MFLRYLRRRHLRNVNAEDKKPTVPQGTDGRTCVIPATSSHTRRPLPLSDDMARPHMSQARQNRTVLPDHQTATNAKGARGTALKTHGTVSNGPNPGQQQRPSSRNREGATARAGPNPRTRTPGISSGGGGPAPGESAAHKRGSLPSVPGSAVPTQRRGHSRTPTSGERGNPLCDSAHDTPPRDVRVRTRPDKRAAHISWAVAASSPSIVSRSSSSSRVEGLCSLDVPRVRAVAIVAGARVGQMPVATRPAPLSPRLRYPQRPELQPLASEARTPLPPMRGTRSASVGVDECVRVTYHSGLAVKHSRAAELAREHFLSGHNVMVLMGNTTRTTCLAEDLLSTFVSSVYRKSTKTGGAIVNEIAVSAYAVMPLDGLVANLLPTSAAETSWQPMRLLANPLTGVTIGNDPPVYMWSKDQARVLSRGLVHNARALGVTPYDTPGSLLWVTLLLKQTRDPSGYFAVRARKPKARSCPASASAGTASDAAGEGEAPNVFTSTMQVVFSGDNMTLVDRLITECTFTVWPLLRHPFGGQCHTSVMVLFDEAEGPASARPLLDIATKLSRIVNRPPHSGSVRVFLESAALSETARLQATDPTLLAVLDALRQLLEFPCSDVPLYDIRHVRDGRPFRRAHEVVLVDAPPPPP